MSQEQSRLRSFLSVGLFLPLRLIRRLQVLPAPRGKVDAERRGRADERGPANHHLGNGIPRITMGTQRKNLETMRKLPLINDEYPVRVFRFKPDGTIR